MTQPTTEKKCDECGKEKCPWGMSKAPEETCSYCHGHQPEEVKCDGSGYQVKVRRGNIEEYDFGSRCPGCPSCQPQAKEKQIEEMVELVRQANDIKAKEGWHETVCDRKICSCEQLRQEKAASREEGYEAGKSAGAVENEENHLRWEDVARKRGYQAGIEAAEGVVSRHDDCGEGPWERIYQDLAKLKEKGKEEKPN